jgi:hypothetical protein
MYAHTQTHTDIHTQTQSSSSNNYTYRERAIAATVPDRQLGSTAKSKLLKFARPNCMHANNTQRVSTTDTQTHRHTYTQQKSTLHIRTFT